LIARHADLFFGSRFEPFASCSDVPQNLTSGRCSKQLTPKSLILEATAREDGTNLYGGILQPGRYAAHPPRSDEAFASPML
jgi:hypothetical protein